jgi:hypothetical protein
MPRITFACLCAAALALLPACSSGGQEVPAVSAASTGSSSADSAGESSGSDAAPPAETSGTESARPQQNDQASLTVASLPIGANADLGCLVIRFRDAASEVPAGMRLVVHRIWFNSDAIAFGGSGCSGGSPVCQEGLVLTESGSDECFASVTSDAGAVGMPVVVQVAASVDCVGGNVPACVQFKEKLESDEKNVGTATFSIPPPREPDASTTDQPPPPDSTDSGTTTSS